MSQNPVQIPTSSPLSGLSMLGDANAAFATLLTLASGASAPTASGLGVGGLAGMLWHDTANNLLKLRDQADGTWILIGALDETNKLFCPASPLLAASANQGVSGTNHYANFVATAALTLTLSPTAALWNGFAFSAYAFGGAVTVTPNAADKINNGTTGAPITLTQGQSAIFVTDGTGNWWTICLSTTVPPTTSLWAAKTNGAVTASAGTILTAARLTGGIVTRSGQSGAITDTTDSAANIVGAVAGAAVNGAFETCIVNNGTYGVTLAGGTGVTLNGIGSIPPGTTLRLLAVMTNVSAGSQAVSFYGLSTGFQSVAANQFLAGPVSGAAAPAAPRMLAMADMPGAMPYPLIGAARNLKIVQTSATTAQFTADEIFVETALGGSVFKLAGPSLPLNLGASGVGGMDSGAAPSAADLSIYLIYNPGTVTAALLACAGTSSNGSVYSGANLPAGYTASALVGSVVTNGSGQLAYFIQRDRAVYLGSPVVVLSSGISAGAFASISLAAAVPANAVAWGGIAGLPTTSGASAPMALAADANGTALKYIDPASAVLGFLGFNNAMAFENLPMITPQTAYYQSYGGSNPNKIAVVNYSI